MDLNGDVRILRDLAERYAEVAHEGIQEERRDLWRQHNSLVPTRPPIYVRAFAWREVPQSELQCQDPFYRSHENYFRQQLYRATFGDDYIIEPWITQHARYVIPDEGPWGLEVRRIPSPEPRGAWKYDPPIKELGDVAGLVPPHHVIDEQATAQDVARLQDAIGDILEVNASRAPFYRVWHADLSTDLAYLRELGQVMWDMVDHPAWLHELLAFMRDGVLTAHQEAEAAGDWHLADHENQAMPYALELLDPAANSESIRRKQLWTFVAAQEMAQVSPAMHDEFMLQYQLPIMRAFGLVAYGCCEDLTHKIDMLRQIPNLRRIAVSPFADVHRCAEQIGDEYVLSWRPSPAEMVSVQFEPDHIRKTVRDALDAARLNDCIIDITLKDVETVQGHPERIHEWVRIVREVIEAYG